MLSNFATQSHTQRADTFRAELKLMGITLDTRGTVGVLLGQQRETLVIRLEREWCSVELLPEMPFDDAQSIHFGLGKQLRIVGSPGNPITYLDTPASSGVSHYHAFSWIALRSLVRIFVQRYRRCHDTIDVSEELARLSEARNQAAVTAPPPPPAPPAARPTTAEEALALLWRDMLDSLSNKSPALECCLLCLRTTTRLELDRLAVGGCVATGIVDGQLRGPLWTAVHDSGLKLTRTPADTLMHVYRDRIELVAADSLRELRTLWSASQP